ncbi:glycosyltransferase [Singulisphaera acidiphila]|nr:glycosyltransferase [Singulisphaera acidiphila]
MAGEFIPAGKRILIVSKGDEDLLRVADRETAHFPQAEGGGYAGHHPGDSEEAVGHLENLRAQGWEYLILPATSLWWLSHYTEFESHLRTHHECVCTNEAGIIFRLSGSTSLARNGRSSRASAFSRNGYSPSPPPKAANVMEEYARIKLRQFLAGPGRLRFPKVDEPVVSIVIPTYQQAHYTLLGLESLLVADDDVPFEVIVVDNASTDDTEALLSRVENIQVANNDCNLGFGEACNRGAKMARGEFVCFLNNDTLGTPGWLSVLVETARSEPRCGGVGPKLVHPSGRLQEAGGILWRDGSNLGYGRNANPTDPEYDYVRDVDYCSGACFLMRKDLFLALGGFDPRYAPAYCEDTDLCMAIREADLRVVYQPRACVFHIEFGSSEAGHAVELQLRNRARFRAKWRLKLRQYPAAGSGEEWLARDRREGRRILVADDRVPDAGLGSGFPRARTLLESLASLGYIVTFLPLNNVTALEPATSELQQLGIEVLHGVKNIRERLSQRHDLYDAILVSRPHNAHWIPVIKEFNPEAAVIYDAEAVFCLRDALQAEVEGKNPLPPLESKRRLRKELSLADDANAVIAVSEQERALFTKHNPDIPVLVWGASILTRNASPSFDARRDYLFLGSLATPPNADALRLLLDAIFPAIRERSNARLTVVGAPVPASTTAADAPGSVVLTGYVNDVSPFFDRARVFLAPHRFAAGVPYKVIEAMAAGLPCVLSPLLAQQLEVTDGAEALVGDGVDDFRLKALRLHEDKALWLRIQQNALRLIRDRFDPAKMREALGNCIEGAFESHFGHASHNRRPAQIVAAPGTTQTIRPPQSPSIPLVDDPLFQARATI